MSWITILLIGWPVASLIGGPLIGRFVGIRMDNPEDPPEVPASESPAKKAAFSKSALTAEL